MVFMETLEKAGINGLISAAATAAYFGTNAVVVPPFMSNTMPLYAMIFLGGVAASVATDTLHLFMKDEIPISKKSNDRTSVIVGMAVNAVMLAGVLEVVDSGIASSFGRFTALGIGAATEFAAASSYTYLKEKMYL